MIYNADLGLKMLKTEVDEVNWGKGGWVFS